MADSQVDSRSDLYFGSELEFGSSCDSVIGFGSSLDSGSATDVGFATEEHFFPATSRSVVDSSQQCDQLRYNKYTCTTIMDDLSYNSPILQNYNIALVNDLILLLDQSLHLILLKILPAVNTMAD